MTVSHLHDPQPRFPCADDDIFKTVACHEHHNANFPMYVYKRDTDEDVTQVSFGQFIRAARRVPALLDLPSPSSQTSRVVVAMIAQLDTLAYNAVELGLMISGYIPYLMSPRNTATAIVHMLKSTDCHHILATNGTIKELMESVQYELSKSDPEYGLSITEVPSFSDLFPDLADGNCQVNSNTTSELYSPPHSPIWDSVGLYLHSSGSTGLPKTIGKTHRQIRGSMAAFPSFSLFKTWSPRVRMLGVQLPPFHGMGSAVTLMLPLFYCVTVSVFPPVVTNSTTLPVVPTPDAIIDHIERTKSTCTLTVPGFLQTWAYDPHAMEVLQHMDYVTFGGGGLSSDVGSILRSRGVRLYCAYGGTEIGGIASSSHKEEDQEDWDYVEFSDITTPRWIPQGDGTYELQFLTNEKHVPSVENLADVRGYSTSDLFRPHPTKPHLWKIVGRIDDVIVHSSGEKTVPGPIEDAIASSPLVKDAVVFGQGFDQPGVLVEPSFEHTIDGSDLVEVARFRNLIWPDVEKANQLAPSFSRIFKEMILVTDRSKPLPRAGKGTLLKKGAIQSYRSEIEALYANTSSVDISAQCDPPKTWDYPSVSRWIFENIVEITSGKPLDKYRSFFDQGMDSLGATILRRRIASGLKTLQDDSGKKATSLLTQTIVYNNPSVNFLSARILELLSDGDSTEASIHVDVVEEMITKYSFNEPITTKNQSHQSGPTVVLITGSTGYFGSQILELLLKDERIQKIYALNRPGSTSESIIDRHIRRFEEKGLDRGLLGASKLIHVETDYSTGKLGLDEVTYAQISSCVNVIIHAAWKVNFNLPLSTFEEHIRGTYNLIQLARLGGHAHDVKFIFVSSVGVAQSWPSSNGPYVEEIVAEAKYAVGKGYGESKYIAERILSSSGLKGVSVRLGQITGGIRNNAWANSDWVPIMVKSSIRLGALPTARGDVTWIPTDAAAGCILDLTFYDGQYPSALNLVHHNPVGWNEIMKSIKDALHQATGTDLALIPFQEWMKRLDNVAKVSTEKEVERIPAILLYDFFQGFSEGDKQAIPGQTDALGLPRFSTEKLKLISNTFKELAPLTSEHTRGWVRYWGITGRFDRV